MAEIKAYRVSYVEDGTKWYLSFGEDTTEVLKAELFDAREVAEEVIKEDAEYTKSSADEYSIEEITIVEA